MVHIRLFLFRTPLIFFDVFCYLWKYLWKFLSLPGAVWDFFFKPRVTDDKFIELCSARGRHRIVDIVAILAGRGRYDATTHQVRARAARMG